jgi:hypothetical protein
MNMTPFESWADGLEWGEETLIEQRERLVRLVLSPEQLERREKMVKNVNKQLELF